eukprot:195142_1
MNRGNYRGRYIGGYGGRRGGYKRRGYRGRGGRGGYRGRGKGRSHNYHNKATWDILAQHPIISPKTAQFNTACLVKLNEKQFLAVPTNDLQSIAYIEYNQDKLKQGLASSENCKLVNPALYEQQYRQWHESQLLRNEVTMKQIREQYTPNFEPARIFDAVSSQWTQSSFKQKNIMPYCMCIHPKTMELYIYGSFVEQSVLNIPSKARKVVTHGHPQNSWPWYPPKPKEICFGLFKCDTNQNKMKLLKSNLLQTFGIVPYMVVIDDKLHIFTHNCELIWNEEKGDVDICHKFGNLFQSQSLTTHYIENKGIILFFSKRDIYEFNVKQKKMIKLELKIPNKLSIHPRYSVVSSNQRFVMMFNANDPENDYNGYDPNYGLNYGLRPVSVTSEDIWVFDIEKRVFIKSRIRATMKGLFCAIIIDDKLHLLDRKSQTHVSMEMKDIIYGYFKFEANKQLKSVQNNRVRELEKENLRLKQTIARLQQNNEQNINEEKEEKKENEGTDLMKWLSKHRLASLIDTLDQNDVKTMEDLKEIETEQEIDELIQEMGLGVIKRKKFRKAMRVIINIENDNRESEGTAPIYQNVVDTLHE